jgi:hypothetical protein
MGRDGWILLRAYAPAVARFGLAVLVMVPLGGLHANALAAGMFDVLRWGPIAMAGGAGLLVCSASCRLWQWERGNGPTSPRLQ